jgi:uncharacterized protein
MASDAFAECGRAGKPLAHCHVVDAHGHLGPDPASAYVTTEVRSVVAAMDRIGIDVMCVSAEPALFGDAARGNRLVEEALRAYPGRFFGYAAADVGYPERIVPELERCMAAGFRAVKVWSYGVKPGPPYDHENYRPVFEFADAHRLPVLAHTWGGELAQIEPRIGRYPGITWLLAHTGSMAAPEYIRMAREYPAIYLETCLSSCPRGMIEALVAAGLADKVVWGSDAIFMSSAQQIGRVLFARIDPEDKARILGGNARRALGMDP